MSNHINILRIKTVNTTLSLKLDNHVERGLIRPETSTIIEKIESWLSNHNN